jgi:hypothetical protein
LRLLWLGWYYSLATIFVISEPSSLFEHFMSMHNSPIVQPRHRGTHDKNARFDLWATVAVGLFRD